MDLSWEFEQADELIHLNHAAVSPWPRRTAEAVCHFAEENRRQGSLNYPHWLVLEDELRRRLAQLVNAPSPDDIALVKNTSEALSFVAYGLDWQAGDNVVISDEEFPSNRIVWESLADLGVEVRRVPLRTEVPPESALMASADERTRVLSVSSVQFGSGLRLYLAALGAFCRANNILFCVDAIQSVGAERIDVEAIQADFLAADGHKWMMGPEGLGLFYCRPDVRERLRLREFGWHMVEHPGEFDRTAWQPAASARRFECGSPNMLAAFALHASTGLLLELGMDKVEQMVQENSRYLMSALAQRPGIGVVTPREPGRFGGIVTFRHCHQDNGAIFERLTRAGVFCARRGGGIRFSPHFYTPRAKLDRALELLGHTVAALDSAE